MKKICAAVLFCLAYLTGTVQAATPAPNTAFDQLVDDYFNLYFQFHPTGGTSSGFHQYDSRLEDFSRASLEAEVSALENFLPRLDAYGHDRLLKLLESGDLAFLHSQIQGRLLELKTVRMWEKDPDGYASGPAYSVFLLIERNFAPPSDRMRSVIEREKKIPSVLEAARKNLQNPPKVYTEIALEQLPGTINFFRKDVPAAFQSVKDEALLAELKASTKLAVDALEKYQTYLQQTVLPASKGDFRLGADTFAKKLLYDEMVDIPLERLRAIGYDDLRRNQEQLKKVSAEIDAKRSAREVLSSLQQNHPPADQLLQTFRGALGSLRQFINDKKIVTLPSQVEPAVEETPPFARALTTAAMETPGPYDSREMKGIFQVSLPEPGWNPTKVEDWMRAFSRGTILSTSIHEAYPGHYVQYLFSLDAPSKIRKLLYCNSNSEGWAHYTEQMMLDQGYTNDPKMRMGQLQDALLRDARFIAGIEMHTGSMTVEQATRFFVEEGYQVPSVAEVEARRGTSDPTYLVYTLGKLQIMKLRADLEQKQGGKFSLQEFHDRFLQQGGLPIKLIRVAMLGNDSPTL